MQTASTINDGKNAEKKTMSTYRRAIMDFKKMSGADRLQFFGTEDVFEAVESMQEDEFIASVRNFKKPVTGQYWENDEDVVLVLSPGKGCVVVIHENMCIEKMEINDFFEHFFPTGKSTVLFGDAAPSRAVIKHDASGKAVYGVDGDNIIEITLLPRYQYYNYAACIPTLENFKKSWWLYPSNPIETDDMECVDPIDKEVYGCDVGDDYAVRPVLVVKSHNFQIDDEVEFGKKLWTYIGGNYLLCNTAFCEMAFKKDRDSLDYESSDIKKYLDNWLKNAKSVVAGGQIWESSHTGERVMVCATYECDKNIVCYAESDMVYTFRKEEFIKEFTFTGKIVNSFGGMLGLFTAVKKEFRKHVEEIIKLTFPDNRD